jgi:hypothetical protein
MGDSKRTAPSLSIPEVRTFCKVFTAILLLACAAVVGTHEGSATARRAWGGTSSRDRAPLLTNATVFPAYVLVERHNRFLPPNKLSSAVVPLLRPLPLLPPTPPPPLPRPLLPHLSPLPPPATASPTFTVNASLGVMTAQCKQLQAQYGPRYFQIGFIDEQLMNGLHTFRQVLALVRLTNRTWSSLALSLCSNLEATNKPSSKPGWFVRMTRIAVLQAYIYGDSAHLSGGYRLQSVVNCVITVIVTVDQLTKNGTPVIC